MIDWFAIFTRGGIVLWCFNRIGEVQEVCPVISQFVQSVILQERKGGGQMNHPTLSLKYKLDNEFELVFIIAYQRILQLSYVDKFLDDIQLRFRDKYDEILRRQEYLQAFSFQREFDNVLKDVEETDRLESKAPKQMRSYTESQKAKRLMPLVEDRSKKTPAQEPKKEEPKKSENNNVPTVADQELPEEDALIVNREMLKKKMQGKEKKPPEKKAKASPGKKSKTGRVWDVAYGGKVKNAAALDYSKGDSGNMDENAITVPRDPHMVGTMRGELQGIDIEESTSEDEEEFEEEEVEVEQKPKSRGMFSLFRGLVGHKTITKEAMVPVLEKMTEHLITKNVASEIAEKLCESVGSKLEGKVLGTFQGISSAVKETMHEALVQLLSPKRRIDILRDIIEAKRNHRPYVVAFCGVNGVGKSTNLAKICFWLIENNFRVLIAACDTFRAGAVEQLRTHTRHLNALHPPEKHDNLTMVQLYEKGYGKDAAGIAMEAVNFARDMKIDVVLVDTAGRMQDNEPLMRALAKLIKVNEPDLVLFVGEALVGNEAVDQLMKFNQALADNSASTNPHLIDGIVLTKFDTIDDKVGAAISMSYITGQPIMFVGTGQTYRDLRSLDAKAVIQTLMK
ncbi:unnamed protein product [Darwinula stevensoni]|uniref:SRP54-type proteins GTP-binding domain-containing protein n=1 Tax=Darwinula stevensoni TaxID=69355 RepID=A0A7R9ABU9_9CRUS|nr:unnamed protein product [Darwinula stevensoni]CAG0899705.1 unnamed protein product [Darwinula stevensoni]